MDFGPGGRILREHWKLVLTTALLAAFLAYGVSFLFAPTYGASSQVLVRARETRFLTGTGQDLKNQPGVVDATLAKSLTETTSALVSGRAVAEEVVRTLGLDRPRPVDDSLLGQVRTFMKTVRNYVVAYVKYGVYREPATAFEAAVGEVQESLEAKPIKDSYLIEIKAVADRPELAADIANAAATALVSVSQERFKSDSAAYTEFLKGQVDDAQAKVDKIQQDIRAYKEQQGIVDVTEELKLSAGTEQSIRDLLRAATVDLQAANAELASINASLSRISATETATSTVTTGRSETTTTSTSPNRVYQDLVSRRATAQATIASLEARQKALQHDLETRTNLLPQQEARLAELDRQLAAASDAYRAVRASYDAASLNSASGAEEVSVADNAAPPLYPERPLRYLFVLVGLMCGGAAGIGLAELWSRRMRTRRFTAALGPARPTPVLQPQAATPEMAQSAATQR